MSSVDAPPIDQELAAAIFARDFHRAAVLLDRGAQINREIRRTETFDRDVVEETTTYLIDASAAGHVDAMEFLLKRGADPNIASAYAGRTALLAAAMWGQAAAVDLLLAHGADVAAVDRNSQAALGYATQSVNPTIVRSLLAGGARGTFSRLGFSIKGGAEAREVVRLLLEHGVDIDELDDWGRTPLMWAAKYADLETVRFMIEQGADVNRVSEANMNGVCSFDTAIGLARERKRKDVIALLLEHSARDAPIGDSMAQALGLFGWAVLTFTAAALGALASVDARTFYAELNLPSWAPPASIFGPVWTALYALMAVSAWLVWRRSGSARARTPLVLFVAQLAANALWSWLFFAWHQGALASAEVVVLWCLVVATVISFQRVSRLAAVLLYPYLAWTTFASVLTFTVWRLNPGLL